MKPTSIAIAAFVLATIPFSVSSAPPARSRGAPASGLEAVASTAPYAMSGARLMDAPDAVASALTASGYEPDNGILSSSTGPSFEDQVETRVRGRAPEHPHDEPTIQLWRKGQETLRVWYAAYPGGSRATMFQWKTEGASPSPEEIVATLTKRYGPGWRLKPFMTPQWCSPMPCSDRAAILRPGIKEIWLTEPELLGQPASVNARLDAAVRAGTGAKAGSF